MDIQNLDFNLLKTLQVLLEELKSSLSHIIGQIKDLTGESQFDPAVEKATIVMDAGIASEGNIKWLKENQYP